MENTTNKISICKVKTYVKIKDLKLHPQNPRKIEPERLEQLKKSIMKKGFYEPILVWKKGGVVLSGNHRLMAARELIQDGYEFVAPTGEKDVLPVVIEDVEYKIAESILFEANNHYATWIDDKLKEAIKAAEEHGSDARDFGFTDQEIAKMLKKSVKELDSSMKLTKIDLERELGPDFTNPESYNPVKSSDFEVLEDEFDYITFPKKQVVKFKGYLEKLAIYLNPEHKKEDSLSEAFEVLLRSINESGIIDELTKGNSDDSTNSGKKKNYSE